MAEYRTNPVWTTDGSGQTANPSPTSMDLPRSLAQALSTWASTYTSTLNILDPAESGFATETEAVLFNLWGQSLASRLSLALRQPVEYFDLQTGAYVTVRG